MSPSSRPFACGGFSRRKPEEREPSALGAPGLFVRPHAQLEGALRRRHVASVRGAVQPISQWTRATSG